MQSPFDEKQLKELDKALDKRFISDRKGGSGRKLRYLEGHDAIDQADRLFGYGNWGYETLACEQTIIHDLLTGEPVGIAYKARVRLDVRGCIPLTEDGLKADWAAVYRVPDNEIESRWPKFKMWALQSQVQQLTADHKIALYSKIDQQRQKSA